MDRKQRLTVQVTGLDPDDVSDLQARASKITGSEMSRSAAIKWAVRQNVLASQTSPPLTELQKAEIDKRKALAEAARVRAALGQEKLDAPRRKAEARNAADEARATRLAEGRARGHQKAYEWRVNMSGQESADAYCREYPESDEAHHYRRLHESGNADQQLDEDDDPIEAPTVAGPPPVDWRARVRQQQIAEAEFAERQRQELAEQERINAEGPQREHAIDMYMLRNQITLEAYRRLKLPERKDLERKALEEAGFITPPAPAAPPPVAS